MCDCRTTAKKMLLEAATDNSKYVVVVGDKGTGKTSLCHCLVTSKFLCPGSPMPPDSKKDVIIDGKNYTAKLQEIPQDTKKDVIIDGKDYTARLHETPWDSAYSHLRTLCYDKADVIILCFAVDNQESLVNVTKKWYPEIKKHKPSVPIILVATKCDLKSDETVRCPISYRNGHLIADEISAFKYVECSAKTTEGCLDALKVAVAATLS